jgi:hypothetical protein
VLDGGTELASDGLGRSCQLGFDCIDGLVGINVPVDANIDIGVAIFDRSEGGHYKAIGVLDLDHSSLAIILFEQIHIDEKQYSPTKK